MQVGKFLLLEVSEGGKGAFGPNQEALLGKELKS